MKCEEYETLCCSELLGEVSIEETEAIYNIPNSKMTIYAVININEQSEPYFRIRIWDNEDSEIFISRLSMINPKYMKTENEDYELSNEEIDKLLHALNHESQIVGSFMSDEELNLPESLEIKENLEKPLSIWQNIIYTMNDLHLINKFRENEDLWYNPISLNASIPNYNLLKK